MDVNALLERFLKNRVLTHVLFWLVLIFLYTQVFFNYGDFYVSFVNSIVLFPAIIGAAYWLTYYQIPKFIETKRYWRFAGSWLLSAYFFTVMARLATIYISEPILGTDQPLPNMWATVLISPDRLIRNYLMSVYIGPLIMASIKTVRWNLEAKKREERLEHEKQKAELNFLKAQIHPHFLFNTLNNLYTLTLQKSDEAPKTVVKLSEMLDYMLYQCNDKVVPISKEIQLINNYIDLEKLRYGERLDLKFEVNIDDQKSPIAPLILLSLVENAFKHGASGSVKKAIIRIKVEVTNNQLSVVVFNSKPVVVQNDQTNFKAGIGVSNIKRQLELVYPEKYTLTTEEEEETYRVELKIILQEL